MGGRGRSVELKFWERAIESGNAAPSYIASQFGAIDGTTPDHLSTANWYGTDSLLAFVKQGTNSNQRIGRKITLKSINIKLLLQPAVNIQTDLTVCVWLVMDKQANGTMFTAADVFGKPGAVDAGQIPVTQVQNLPIIVTSNYLVANTQRFTILGKKCVTITNQIPFTTNAVSSRGGAHKSINFYKKLNTQIEYGGVTGAIGEIKSNNIGIIICADANLQIDDTTPNYVAYGNMMLRYTDQ